MKKIKNLNEIKNLAQILKHTEIISYGPSKLLKLENMYMDEGINEKIFAFCLTQNNKRSLLRLTGNKNLNFILEIDLEKSEVRESTNINREDSLTGRSSDIRIKIVDFAYEETEDYLSIDAEFSYGFLYGCFGRRIITIEKAIKIKNLQEGFLK